MRKTYVPRKHGHYHRSVAHLETIDPYRIIKLFGVTDPCMGHIVKKALCTGVRGYKDYLHDLEDILDTVTRAIEMHKEDSGEVA